MHEQNFKKLPAPLYEMVRRSCYPDIQMKLLEEFLLVLNTRSWPSRRTLNDYARKARLVNEKGRKLQDYVHVPSSFFAMRAALVWNARLKFVAEAVPYINDVLSRDHFKKKGIDIAEGDNSTFIRMCTIYIQSLREIESVQRNFFVEDIDNSRRKSTSKMHSLRKLPDGWLDSLWKAVAEISVRDHLITTQFEEIVATLALVAPRPVEFFRDWKKSDADVVFHATGDEPVIKIGDGIVIQYDGNYLIFTIPGGKMSDKKSLVGIDKGQGQSWRRITVSLATEQACLLRDRIIAGEGQPIVLGLPNFSRISPWLRKLSTNCFPDIAAKGHVTAYVFRHLLGGQMKAEGFDKETIAMALGHRSDGTQQHYGRARLARDSCSIVKVEASNGVRCTSRDNLQNLRKKSRPEKKYS